MNKSETELLERIADNISRTVENGQTQRAHMVSNTIDNPLVWVSFLGILFLVVGSLLMFVYTSAQDSQNNAIVANKSAIDELKEAITDVLDVVRDIQNDQEKQSEATERLALTVEKIVDRQNTILSSRFEDKDFPIYIKPYADRIKNIEDEQKKRAERFKEIDEINKELTKINARLGVRDERD